MFIKFK